MGGATPTLDHEGEELSKSQICTSPQRPWHKGQSAKTAGAISVELPLNSYMLTPLLLCSFAPFLQHNLFPSLLFIAACAMSQHYSTLMGKYLTTRLLSPSGTGKTTVTTALLKCMG